jgi:hypothetical protein
MLCMANGIDQHVLHASECEQAGVACKPYLRWNLQGTLPIDAFLVDFMFPHIYSLCTEDWRQRICGRYHDKLCVGLQRGV